MLGPEPRKRGLLIIQHWNTIAEQQVAFRAVTPPESDPTLVIHEPGGVLGSADEALPLPEVCMLAAPLMLFSEGAARTTYRQCCLPTRCVNLRSQPLMPKVDQKLSERSATYGQLSRWNQTPTFWYCVADLTSPPEELAHQPDE